MSVELSLIFMVASLLIIIAGVFVSPKVGSKIDFAKIGCLFCTLGTDCFFASMIMFIIAVFTDR